MKKTLSWNRYWAISMMAVLVNTCNGDVKTESKSLADISKSEPNKFSDSKYALCKIGIVDMSIISAQSMFMQKINAALQQKQDALKIKIEAFQKEVSEKSTELKNTANAISAKNQQKKAESLKKEFDKKEKALQEEQAKIEQFYRSMMMEIIRQLKLILAQLSEKHGCQVVVDSEALLYYNKETCINLTYEAIASINAITTEDAPLKTAPAA